MPKLALVIILMMCTPVFAIVIDDQVEAVDYPDVVYSWGSSTSCVAVAKDWVIMTVHQGGGVGTTVDGKYIVDYVYTAPSGDIRLAHLKDANLNFVNMKVAISGQEVVMGGFGCGRGDPIEDYGFYWNNIYKKRYATNVVSQIDRYNIYCQFGHCIASSGDSGGGILFKENNEWFLAGIIRTTSRIGQSWYGDKSGGTNIGLVIDRFTTVMQKYQDQIIVYAYPNYDWVYKGNSLIVTVEVLNDRIGNTSYLINDTLINGSSCRLTVFPLGNYDVVVQGMNGGIGVTQAKIIARRLGDINGDGCANAMDKLEINRALNGLITPNRSHDLNGDGSVNATDKLIINKVLNGLL